MPARRLTVWFARAKRPMPWRSHPEPYRCWLSEIMLQQTTYEQALPYYERFLARFPDVKALAAADEREVLEDGYSYGVFRRRNQRLVDLSGVCLAYMVRSASGTGQTVGMARAAGLRVFNLAVRGELPPAERPGSAEQMML